MSLMRFFTPLLASVALVAATSDAAKAADIHNAYAGPNTWGPSVPLRAHLGSASYTISYNAIGNTSVIGEVTYFAPNGHTVTVPYSGSITFRTGYAVAQPTVRFKGTPLGSAVRVTVTP